MPEIRFSSEAMDEQPSHSYVQTSPKQSRSCRVQIPRKSCLSGHAHDSGGAQLNSLLRKAGAVIAVRRYGSLGWDYRLLNLVTKNRPKAAEHMEESWQPPMGMWKNSRKLCFPRRAITVVSRQFPCPGGSLETSKSNCRT